MNEKLVQDVIEIEKAAQEAYDAAVRQAEQLPRDAQQEAEAMIEKAVRGAQEEARRIVQAAQAEDASAQILEAARRKMSEADGLTRTHQERAVKFVLAHVAGRQ